MSDQIVYSFEDSEGEEYTDWTTTDYSEAKRYARDNECRLVENTYRWYDSETIEDYSREDEDEDECSESDEDIQARIDAGVTMLTEYFGDTKTWVDRVPMDGEMKFDINDPSACVLHYVFADPEDLSKQGYSAGCDALELNSSGGRVCDLGFCACGDEGDRLTELWVETIRRLWTPR